MSVISQLDKNIWDPKQREDIEKIITYQQKQLYNLIEKLDRKDLQLKIAEKNIAKLEGELERNKIEKEIEQNKIDFKVDNKYFRVIIEKVDREKKEMEDKYEDIFDNLYKRLQYLEANIVSNLDELD